MKNKVLVPIFADQLSKGLSALQSVRPDEAVILMMEVGHEADHVPHHRQKLVFLFSAMRHFAVELQREGYDVAYVSLDDPDNTGAFQTELMRAVSLYEPIAIRVTEPSVHRVLDLIQTWAETQSVPVSIMPDHRFTCSKQEFANWAAGRKQLRMEYFYREMRRKTGLLMDGNEPEGGQWNFDKLNRKPASSDLFMPERLRFDPDTITQSVIEMVGNLFPERFGALDGFSYGVSRTDALRALDHFVKFSLPRFGDFQDAMLTDEPYIYHSLLSLYLNAGLLEPLEICEAVELAYKNGDAPLNSAEGYIRQIIGWREYIRGIYWLKMPNYESSNFLKADRDLPWFYWTGETDMHCMSQAIGQTIDHSYAHHIQRLMITGNFALLAGVSPSVLHEWYLAVYIDAFEWVELPNTIGMSQFADGGLLASKPYISSGAYINRMSNYCTSCRYDVKAKIGDRACPFNSLYWDFLARHEDKLSTNPRMGMMYRNLRRMETETLMELRDQAQRFLEDL